MHWIFSGRSLPTNVPIWVPFIYETTLRFGGNRQVAFRVEIQNSVVRVDARVTVGPAINVETLRLLVMDAVRAELDYLGYLKGSYVDLEILEGTDQNTGFQVNFDTSAPFLGRQELVEIPLDGFTEAAGDTAARFALADFRRALADPMHAGFHCYRAMEGMMQTMKTGNAVRDADAWAELRGKLHIRRELIDLVKEKADRVRHGGAIDIMYHDRVNVIRITDNVIYRYLKFLLNRRDPLPLNLFPELATVDDLVHPPLTGANLVYATPAR